ncbi:DUF2812 domain-containing protein [Clostridium lundense]|uniref:DUF2812 domain-containing protein n=1 Tax=Clostridium lundense TaxID=319475 RepID=UPI00048480D1|nr:DUF2812 domain-containing protein [Clostridium lundense]
MKSKYVMINGFAFSEESDMKILGNYAREGWILEDIVAGFFYKLKKDIPKDIEYSLDYQNEATEEYFSLFSAAGWTPVISLDNGIHIFMAQAGTKPIYSDRESEIDKYDRVKKQTSKGTVYSLITAIALTILLVISAIAIRPIFLIVLLLLIVDIFVFIFNFMPYLAYKSRVKQLNKNGKCDGGITSSKNLWKIDAFTGIVFMIIGIMDFVEKSYFATFFILLGIFYIISSLNKYKQKKKSL